MKSQALSFRFYISEIHYFELIAITDKKINRAKDFGIFLEIRKLKFLFKTCTLTKKSILYFQLEIKFIILKLKTWEDPLILENV